jgi:hypothetical protein
MRSAEAHSAFFCPYIAIYFIPVLPSGAHVAKAFLRGHPSTLAGTLALTLMRQQAWNADGAISAALVRGFVPKEGRSG